MKRRSFVLGAPLVLGTLYGCATPQRTAAADASIHSVAIVTAIQDEVPLRRIGLTVFNNDYAVLPMQGELNPFVVKIASEALRQKRPEWTLKAAGTDPRLLSAHIRKVWDSWGSKDEPLADRWPAVARAADVDALLVIEEVTHELGSGIDVQIRALPGLEPRLLVGVALGVRLVDRDGSVLSKRGTQRGLPTEAKGLGVTDQLASAQEPAVAERLRNHVKAAVQASLLEGLERLGY